MTKKRKIVASIEARMASSRLPGKVLMEICGKSVLLHMVDRVRRSDLIDEVVIAATTNEKDDSIARLAEREGVICFRGSEDDVLQRVSDCHKELGTEIIVELTGDCPLIDPYWVDRTIEMFLEGACDFASNCIPMTFPRGLDCKVFRSRDLVWMAQHIHDPAVREHVSLYFYEEAGRYRLKTVAAPDWLRHPEYRWTLDTKEDFEVIKHIYENLYPGNRLFSSREIMRFIENRPDVLRINAEVVQKNIR